MWYFRKKPERRSNKTDGTAGHSCGGRRRWLMLAATSLALVVWLARDPLLRQLGSCLVAQPAFETDGFVCFSDSADGRFDYAAAAYRDRGCRILLVESRPSRLVECGVLPNPLEKARAELGRRGIPPAAITTVGDRRTDMDTPLFLGEWLAGHPRDRIVLVSSRFQSGVLRARIDEILPPDRAERISVCGLRDRQYDETNWWQCRLGAKEFFYGCAGRVQLWLCGPVQPPRERWDPDRYEGELRRLAQEGA